MAGRDSLARRQEDWVAPDITIDDQDSVTPETRVAAESKAVAWIHEVSGLSKAEMAKIRHAVREQGYGGYIGARTKEETVGLSERLVARNASAPMFMPKDSVSVPSLDGKGTRNFEILKPVPDENGFIRVRELLIDENGRMQWKERPIKENHLFTGEDRFAN